MNLEQLITETIHEVLADNVSDTNKIPIGVSNRHVHLSNQAVERLFGKNYKLQKQRDLSQPGQYACQETLTVIGPKGKLINVRVLGPTREASQVEVSLTDGHTLGITPPIRRSGDIEGTPPITLQGPRGQLALKKGLICAERHIHMTPLDAKKHGVEHNEYVKIKITGNRTITFENTLVRVSPNYRLEMHIDMDEANAGNIGQDTAGILLKDRS